MPCTTKKLKSQNNRKNVFYSNMFALTKKYYLILLINDPKVALSFPKGVLGKV